jgi:hypothetical protein
MKGGFMKQQFKKKPQELKLKDTLFRAPEPSDEHLKLPPSAFCAGDGIVPSAGVVDRDLVRDPPHPVLSGLIFRSAFVVPGNRSRGSLFLLSEKAISPIYFFLL